MPEQKIISLDQTVLNTVQMCAFKTKLNFIENLRPNIKAESLELGDLMHHILEVYYGLKGGCADFNSENWKIMADAGLTPNFLEETMYSREELIEFCKQTGLFWATKMNAPPQELEDVIHQFSEYAEFYKHEEWHALAVEEVGSIILYEDEEWKIVYNAKIDIVAEKGQLIAPWDHKTGKRRQTPRSLGNQWIGNCAVLGVNRIMLNKIGFQTSLKPQERFQRFLMEIQETRIQEWKVEVVYWAKQYYWYLENDFWPRNRTSCDKYSGCVYAPICERPPEQRENIITSEFHMDKEWDVAAALEGVE